MRIILLCLLLAPSLARAEPVAMHPALWKVTRDHATIWLFGTIHMLPPDAHWLNGAVAAAADGADQLAKAGILVERVQ